MKIALFCGASALALAAGLGWTVRPTTETTEQKAVQPDIALKDGGGYSEVDVAGATRNFLIYFVVPLWIAAGIADISGSFSTCSTLLPGRSSAA